MSITLHLAPDDTSPDITSVERHTQTKMLAGKKNHTTVYWGLVRVQGVEYSVGDHCPIAAYAKTLEHFLVVSAETTLKQHENKVISAFRLVPDKDGKLRWKAVAT